jgi:hypothetical protein
MITSMKIASAVGATALMIGMVSPSLASTNKVVRHGHSAYVNQLYAGTMQWRRDNPLTARADASGFYSPRNEAAR